MRKLLTFVFIIFTFNQNLAFAEQMLIWGQTGAAPGESGFTKNGLAYDCPISPGDITVSYEVYSYDTTNNTSSLLKSFDTNNDNCNLSVTDQPIKFGNSTFVQQSTGYIYADAGGSTWHIVDPNDDFALKGTYVDPSVDSTIVGRDLGSSSRIVDATGKSMIERKSNGELHIGENSIVTQEVNGVQQFYATDANGDQIDINIKSGTNLLIDGTNITLLSGSGSAVSTNTSNIAANTAAINNLAVDLSGSVALSSALSALPNSSPDAFYTCGIGTGIHDSSSALSAGCASDFSNYAFADNLPSIFQTASFNIGSSFLMNGEPDISEARDTSIKAGITFKFGSVKPTSVADKQNYMLENKIDIVMQENRTLKAQLKEENDTIREENDLLKAQIADINTQLKEENDAIRQENDLLKAQIAEINTQLKALNMLAMN